MSPPSPSLASSSALPDSTVPATYHPSPRPAPVNSLHASPQLSSSTQWPAQLQPHQRHHSHHEVVNPHRGQPIPFERMDTHSIKQELHDVLGEDGLPYWKALNGYLMGQIGRGELEGMVKSWFKGEKVSLHNKLLLSLLNNASAPPASHTPVSPLNAQKRKRVGPEHEEYDVDETYVEPKMRVQHWIMGLGGRERARIRRVMGKAMQGASNGEEEGAAEEVKNGKGAGWNSFEPVPLLPPLAHTSRHLPSSTQLSLRLSQYAKTHSLSLAPDAAGDIGEFMAVGVDSHLGDVLHGLVSLTGRDRPGGETIRIPQASRQPNGFFDHGASSDRHMNGRDQLEQGRLGHEFSGVGGDLPKPDLTTFQHLFLLNSSLHPQVSPAIHRLQTAHTLSEAEWNRAPPNPAQPSPNAFGFGTHSRSASASMPTTSKTEALTRELVGNGLLKLDKAGRQSEMDGVGADGKKERKHNLHWKYEDPAMILKDVLG